MHKLKGEKKNFSKYLASEYYDYSLEPFEDGLLSKIESQIIQKLQPQSHINPTSIQKKASTNKAEGKQKIKETYIPPKTFLTTSYIRNLTEKLGIDAKNCLNGLYEFKVQEQMTPEMQESYGNIYNKLDTVPILFFSMVYQSKDRKQIDAVYLWQINKLCPYKGKKKYMCIDTKHIDEYVAESPSLLLLAKIIPEEGENIIEAKMLSENKLFTKSITKGPVIILRTYNIADFYSTMRINPYQHYIIANHLFLSKVTLSLEKDEEKYSWKVELSKNTPIEEMKWATLYADTKDIQEIEGSKEFLLNPIQLVTSKVCPILFQTADVKSTLEQAFSPILIEHFEDWQIFKDDATNTFLVLGNDECEIFSFPKVGPIHSSRELKNHLYLLNTQGKIFSLDFSHLPNLLIKEISIPSFGILSGKDFQWQVIELCDSAQSKKVEHVVYSFQNKFYIISLVAENAIPKMLLDFNVEDSLVEVVDWNVIFMQNMKEDGVWENLSLIAYVKKGSLSFYNLKTHQHKSSGVYLSYNCKLERRWNIIPTGNAHLYLHDPLFENLIIDVEYGFDIETLFTKEHTLSFQSYTHFIQKNQTDANITKIQVGGPDNSILLLTGEGEPYYEDKINLMHIETEVLLSQIEEKIEPRQTIIVSGEDVEKTLKEARKIKKEILHSKNKELVKEESDKALEILRNKISEKMSKIKKYEVDLDKYKKIIRYSNSWRYRKVEVPETPEEVPKELLDEYEQIKQEKIRVKRQRSYEKSKKNEGKNSKFEP